MTQQGYELPDGKQGHPLTFDRIFDFCEAIVPETQTFAEAQHTIPGTTETEMLFLERTACEADHPADTRFTLERLDGNVPHTVAVLERGKGYARLLFGSPHPGTKKHMLGDMGTGAMMAYDGRTRQITQRLASLGLAAA